MCEEELTIKGIVHIKKVLSCCSNSSFNVLKIKDFYSYKVSSYLESFSLADMALLYPHHSLWPGFVGFCLIFPAYTWN